MVKPFLYIHVKKVGWGGEMDNAQPYQTMAIHDPTTVMGIDPISNYTRF
jgi:hypothetical protein